MIDEVVELDGVVLHLELSDGVEWILRHAVVEDADLFEAVYGRVVTCPDDVMAWFEDHPEEWEEAWRDWKSRICG